MTSVQEFKYIQKNEQGIVNLVYNNLLSSELRNGPFCLSTSRWQCDIKYRS